MPGECHSFKLVVDKSPGIEGQNLRRINWSVPEIISVGEEDSSLGGRQYVGVNLSPVDTQLYDNFRVDKQRTVLFGSLLLMGTQQIIKEDN